MITAANKERIAEADANMEKWIAEQAKRRGGTFRYLRLLGMLVFLVWFACTYVWR
jgi:hypothetical protein